MIPQFSFRSERLIISISSCLKKNHQILPANSDLNPDLVNLGRNAISQNFQKRVSYVKNSACMACSAWILHYRGYLQCSTVWFVHWEGLGIFYVKLGINSKNIYILNAIIIFFVISAIFWGKNGAFGSKFILICLLENRELERHYI